MVFKVKTCQSCHQDNPFTAETCNGCGNKLVKKGFFSDTDQHFKRWVCPKCDRSNMMDNKSCICGEAQKDTSWWWLVIVIGIILLVVTAD